MVYGKWDDYLIEFEKTIMIPMHEQGFYERDLEPISFRPSKLCSTCFGMFIKCYFKYPEILALNYYGMIKLSYGLLEQNSATKRISIKVPVIHFNSIKMEHIEKFNSDLLPDFVKFKRYLVKLRWGRNY